jgi:hypothetical protein
LNHYNKKWSFKKYWFLGFKFVVNKKMDMHILIVEDEVVLYNFSNKGLEEEGYQITSALMDYKDLNLFRNSNLIF